MPPEGTLYRFFIILNTECYGWFCPKGGWLNNFMSMKWKKSLLFVTNSKVRTCKYVFKPLFGVQGTLNGYYHQNINDGIFNQYTFYIHVVCVCGNKVIFWLIYWLSFFTVTAQNVTVALYTVPYPSRRPLLLSSSPVTCYNHPSIASSVSARPTRV